MNPSEPAVEQTPAAVASEPTQTPREAVIAKYEQMYGGEPQQTQLAPVIQAVETPPATPIAEPIAPAVPDVNAALAALMTQVTEMRQQLHAAQNPPPPPPNPADQESWLKLLADGKQSEGEKALAAVLGPQIQQQAVQQALSLMQAERDVNEFTSQIKAQNPDLLAFESYITLGAQNRIAAAQAAKAINSPADYVTVYKDAVKAEIENARKLSQTLRGAGKTEAQARVSEVLASPVLQPTPVNTNREQVVKPQDQQQSPEQVTASYFAERKARQAKLAGMAV